MPIENEDQAISALTDAAAQDAVPAQVSQPSEPVQTGDAVPAVETPDQPRIDVNQLNLPQEAKDYIIQREREMQADYTRKTQEVAAQRREAEQAIEFINALNTDPSFAAQVHASLTDALQAQGYSYEDASAMASQQTQQGYEDESFVDPYMQKIQELESWQAQQEQRFAIADATQRIESGINAVRQANPNYGDEDIKDILTMAFAFNGDVVQAANAYQSIQQRVTEGYLSQKSAVPASLNEPVSSGHAEIPPEGFSGLNDPRLEEAAKQMLANSGAQW